MKTQQDILFNRTRGTSTTTARAQRWSRRLVTSLTVCLMVVPSLSAFAQDKAPKVDKEAGTTELLAVEPAEGKNQTAAPTLENEAKGPDVIRAEAFANDRKFESLKKLDEQIQSLKKLLNITPKDHPDRPQFLFNMAELYFEKSKYYSLKAYETQDECAALEDKKAEQREIDRCKKKMGLEIEEGQRLRKDSITLYGEIIGSFGNFKNMDEVLFYLGSGLIETKQREEGLEVYKRLIGNYPASRYVPNALVAFGDSYFDREDMSQAIKAYDKVTDSYPDSSVYSYALYKKGWCYFNLDDKEKALDFFLQTLNYTKKRNDLPNSKALFKQVKKDIVTTYAFIGAPSKAIPFFKKVTDNERTEWLDMGERLAVYYSDKGKFEDSITMYRTLIKLNQKSVKVIDYQYEVVRNQSSNNTYSQDTLKEIIGLMRLVQIADAGKFKDRDDKAMNYTGKKLKVEELARSWAQTFHREAMQTKNSDLFNKAYYLYKEYMATFEEIAPKEERYKMTFFYAELLYRVEEFTESAAMYEKALQIDPKGQYTEDIVLSAVQAYFNLISVEESRKETNINEINETQEEGKEKVAYVMPTAKEIPKLETDFINACDRYMKYAPEGKKIVDVKYKRAYTLYKYDHYEKAAAGFKQLAFDHPEEDLATISANLHLDALYALRKLDLMEKDIHAYLGEDENGEKVGDPVIKDEDFIEDITAMAAAISFKKCTVFDEQENWSKASTCFVAFFRKYTDSEYGDDALYNAALDFERLSEIGKAIKMRVYLLKAYGGESEHAPITLYNIAANYHALAIYSQAAKFYERFVQYFPEHEKAEDALRNASTFRYGLGQYGKAIENYEKYLELFARAKPEQGSNVAYQIALSYEKMDKKKQAFESYENYIKRWSKNGTNDHLLQSHVKLGLYYWSRAGRKNRQKALKEFKRTLSVYEKLSGEEQKSSVKANDAAAQARFMLGEDIFEDMAEMKVDSKNEKELQKRLKKKQEKGAEGIAVFEQVFAYGRPDWSIASFYRIGDAYENFANSLRSTRCPSRLSYDQCEIYRGLLEDVATQIETEAVNFYVKALDTSKAARWFNKYTKLAEVRLATLRPKEYRKPSEFRAEPDHIQSGFTGIEFLKEIKDKDQLEDLDRGDGAEDDPAETEGDDESAQ